MVTGDLNAALVEWVVQYRISDPVKFLFEVREPSETLRYVSESVMREVVGDRTVDEVITIGRQEIEIRSADQDAGALDQIRHGDQHRPGAAEEHQPARAGAGVLQRGQPGAAGEGEADQRSPARLQQGDPAGRGREGPAHPRGGRLPPQADQRGGRRRRPVQRPAGGIQQGAGSHAPPHLHRDAAGGPAGHALQDHRRRRRRAASCRC